MKKSAKKDFDVARDIVVKRIVDQLEQGIIPWHKPWFGMSKCYNYVTGYCYNIINEMMLDEAGGYINWKKLKELGGEMKEGEEWKDHVRQVVMCWTKSVPAKDKDGNIIVDENGKEKTRQIRGLRYENVVNVKYTTLPPKKRSRRQVPARKRTADIIIEGYLATSGVTLTHEVGDAAFYSPLFDSVTVPMLEQFSDQSTYYSTVFHELGHSTGHESRLNRFDKTARFGNEPYAKEELVAEFTAAILCNYTEVGNSKSERNNAAYIKSWARAIKDNPNMFTTASYAADKAARLIIGGKLEKVVESTELKAA